MEYLNWYSIFLLIFALFKKYEYNNSDLLFYVLYMFEYLPIDRETFIVIFVTVFLFTLILLYWVYVIIKGLYFSKIRKTKYERKDMFSWNEKRFFRTLEKILKDKYWDKYLILSQVRLQDLFKIIEEDYDWSMLDLKIRWHVDFLVVDHTELEPVLWIELNGESHHWYSQIWYDEFKKKLFDKSWEDKSKLPLITFRNNEMKYNDKEREFFKKKLEWRVVKALNNKNSWNS